MELGQTQCTNIYQTTDRVSGSESQSERDLSLYFYILGLQSPSYYLRETEIRVSETGESLLMVRIRNEFYRMERRMADL